MRLKYKLEYSILFIVRFIATVLPLRAAEWIGRRLGDIVWYFFPYRFQIMINNMDIVFPDKPYSEKLRTAHKVYCFFGMMVMQFFGQTKKKNQKLLLENSRVNGILYLTNALEKGKGVILTALHYGNWEYLATWMNLSGIKTSGIYKIMKNPLSDAFFLNLRLSFGDSMEMISTHNGMKAYQHALKRNRVLAVAVDQNAHDKGVKVEFFNNITSIAKGTTVLQYRTDATVMGVIPVYESGRLNITFFPIDVEKPDELNDQTITKCMQKVLSYFETAIKEKPEQWMWFHRLWGKPRKYYKRSFWDIIRY